ncbi:MAG: glycosyltransferase [Chloroflexi bacterium]|nr:MAG: glycosyltransferase [Chloroflexota bacterium]
MLAAFNVLVALVAVALLVFGLTALLNVLTFPRLNAPVAPATDAAASAALGRISVCIPMRNEVDGIARTVRAWRAQTHSNFELLLLDDQSTDGTHAAALAAAAGDVRVRVLTGLPLPAGWLGKNYACQQLADAAQGSILVFTDADVTWEPPALAALANSMQALNADLLTVWPTQQTDTWAERLLVPLIALAVLAYLPLLAVHYLPWPVFAAANGQCLAFRRSAYLRSGGHAAVRANIVEDMAFAYAIKHNRLQLRMADGNGLVRTRMYTNWSTVRDGFAKNIRAGHGGTVALLLSTLLHCAVFVLPPVWLLLGWLAPLPGYPLLALLLSALGIGVRALTAAFSRQRVWDALLMPLSALLMTVVALRALQWHWRGGANWKGRTYASA